MTKIKMSEERLIKTMKDKVIEANKDIKRDFFIVKDGYLWEGCFGSTYADILAFKWFKMRTIKKFLWFKIKNIKEKRKKLFYICLYDKRFQITVWYDEYLDYIRKYIVPVLETFKGYKTEIILDEYI